MEIGLLGFELYGFIIISDGFAILMDFIVSAAAVEIKTGNGGFKFDGFAKVDNRFVVIFLPCIC